MEKFKPLSDCSVAETEKQLADFWQEQDILNQSIENRKDNQPFVFFEGPPTANGRPGIHHVLARTLKDTVTKHKVMQGYKVVRKAGWDTQAPVEIEVEKKLGFKNKQDIEQYGIEKFNEQCRESVFTYEKQWRDMTKRMGYFVNMDDPYITLDNDYIETVWWIMDQFNKKAMSMKVIRFYPIVLDAELGLRPMKSL